VTSLVSVNEPRIGVASDAARELGVLAGRNWLLLLLISLLKLGNVAAVITTSAIQAATTSQRKRTTARPRAEKRRSLTAVSYPLR
jgi:hypothetical protein